MSDIVERLRAGIHFLPRTATEDSPEFREFISLGDAISVNEGDLYLMLIKAKEAATLIEGQAARIERLEQALQEITEHPIRSVVGGRASIGLRGWPACQDLAARALNGGDNG